MYAVVKEGGKQYKVQKGDVLKVEKMEHEPGKEITLTNVLMVGTDENIAIGTPLLEGASVLCQVIENKKQKKIIVFKHKRRKHHRKKQGHRQTLTSLKILNINH